MLDVFLAGMAVVYVPAMCTTAAYLCSVLIREPRNRAFWHEFPFTGLFCVAVMAAVWPVTLPYILLTDTEKPT